jgi:hypothetical protein
VRLLDLEPGTGGTRVSNSDLDGWYDQVAHHTKP